MYSEWSSHQYKIENFSQNRSVLHKLPQNVGRDVAASVVQSIARTLLPSTNSVTDVPLGTFGSEKETRWLMEVLCFALSLPLTDCDIIRDSVHIYCEWLSSLAQINLQNTSTPNVSPTLPTPVLKHPQLYLQDILKHLYNLFVPRNDAGIDTVSRQAVLCHRVLRTVQKLVTDCCNLEEEIWESVLQFLLAIGNILLGPLAKEDSIGDQLSERVLCVLFEVWLLSCSHCFPSPTMWRTLRDLCGQWRRHVALVTQWHRVNLVLTHRVLCIIYGSNFVDFSTVDENDGLLVQNLSDEAAVHAWFRFLHTLQNPADLAQPHVIFSIPKILQMGSSSSLSSELSQPTNLLTLKIVFFRAMHSLSILVNSFIGVTQSMTNVQHISHSSSSTFNVNNKSVSDTKHQSSTQMFKGGVKSSSSAPFKSTSGTAAFSSTYKNLPASCLSLCQAISPHSACVDSILHLFGAWLFEASLAGVKIHGTAKPAISRSRTTSFILDVDTGTGSFTDMLANMESGAGEESNKDLQNMSAGGRAEALSTLCRIFCSHKTGEEINSAYLARFYTVLYYGLQVNKKINGFVLGNVLLSATDLFRVDLDGVNILVPQTISAIEFILSDLELKFPLTDEQFGYDMSPSLIRRSSIHLLLSLLPLPFHFGNVPIKDIFSRTSDPAVTFLSLRLRLVEILIRALTIETDSTNTQMLLGGLLHSMQDLAHFRVLHPSMVSVQHTTSLLETCHGLFEQAASLVCNRLMASWKTDLTVALAALELLYGLASIVPNDETCPDSTPQASVTNRLICKRTVNWICELISYQCSRPAPAHSRDLHSLIVAAFQVLATWLIAHGYLMSDRTCLAAVLEVVELGISGTKSQNRASDVPKHKADKELKPVSLRVKDAAEALLAIIMDQVGSFPPPSGPQSLCSLLDENILLNLSKNNSSIPEQKSLFRYFVLEGTTIIALLEQPFVNHNAGTPTLTALIRGPFGRHAWTMQLRHYSTNKKPYLSSKSTNPERPIPDKKPGKTHSVNHHYFPDIVSQIPLVDADKSIPPLETVMSNQSNTLEQMTKYIRQQADFEADVAVREKGISEARPFPDPHIECRPPVICQEFQTARLFLSHYGLLSPNALKDRLFGSPAGLPPSLAQLDSTEVGFENDLRNLDLAPIRTADTVHVFYMQYGQERPFEILSNVDSCENVSEEFLDLLNTFGESVNVETHPGWSGHLLTSWKVSQEDSGKGDNHNDEEETSGGAIYNGRHRIIYFADAMSEVAFIVPSPSTYQPTARRPSFDSAQDKSTFEPSDETKPKAKSMSLDLESSTTTSTTPPTTKQMQQSGSEKSSETIFSPVTPMTPSIDSAFKSQPAEVDGSQRRPFGVGGFSHLSSQTPLANIRVFVVWLEDFADHQNFPAEEFIATTSTGTEGVGSGSNQTYGETFVYIIFVHMLENGLARIHLKVPPGRASAAIPLIDGLVVNPRILGQLIRQTAINICRRKRLESESYQPPHVRRKAKIKEIVEKYRKHIDVPAFYTSLFQAPSS